MADTSNLNDGKSGASAPGPEAPTGATSSYFKERLLDDAARVSQKDIDELETSVPKKVSSIELKSLSESVGWITNLLERVRALYDMLRDRDFSISLKTKGLVAAALLYFVLPTDIVPDFIPGIGYVDDALVLSTLWKLIGEEIEGYMLFRKNGGKPAPGGAPAGSGLPVKDPAP